MQPWTGHESSFFVSGTYPPVRWVSTANGHRCTQYALSAQSVRTEHPPLFPWFSLPQPPSFELLDRARRRNAARYRARPDKTRLGPKRPAKARTDLVRVFLFG
jgi:hypothetical protein